MGHHSSTGWHSLLLCILFRGEAPREPVQLIDEFNRHDLQPGHDLQLVHRFHYLLHHVLHIIILEYLEYLELVHFEHHQHVRNIFHNQQQFTESELYLDDILQRHLRRATGRL